MCCTKLGGNIGEEYERKFQIAIYKIQTNSNTQILNSKSWRFGYWDFVFENCLGFGFWKFFKIPPEADTPSDRLGFENYDF